MKFREPKPRSQARVKATELLAEPERDKALFFDIHDFFTTEEWDGLVDTLTKFDYDDDEVAEFEARNFLDGALALRFLDEGKLDQLKNHTIAKRIIRGYLRDTDQEVRPEDWQSLNAIAVWLWPEFEQVEEIKDQVTKFRRSAEKKTNRKPEDYLKTGELALLYPDLKDQLGINEQWLRQTNDAINIPGGPDFLKNRGRFSVVRELFFPPEFSDENPSTIKKWVKEDLDEHRKGNFFIDNLGGHLLNVAYTRLVLKQDVAYSNAGIQITDQKSLHHGPELPQRPQV